MSRAVRFLCAALFLGTTGCSLVFSASATLTKAASVHVPLGVTWSAIGFLELLSLAGTLRWLTAKTKRGRLHAIVVVGAAALVTAQAGVTFYGWWGALAPVAVVGTIHMVAETLDDLEPTATKRVDPSEQHEQPDVDTPAPALVEVVDQSATTELEIIQPVDREPTLVDRVRELRERDPRMSERALRDELGVSRHQIRCALIELRSGLSEVAS